MKRLLALFLSALLLTGCGAAAGTAETIDFRQISQQEAAEIMEKEPEALILDVRTPEDFAQGHIAGALNLPNESISQQNLSLLPDKDQTILIYCRSGNRSKQASRKLVDLGYTDILEFGGINTWEGPIVTD